MAYIRVRNISNKKLSIGNQLLDVGAESEFYTSDESWNGIGGTAEERELIDGIRRGIKEGYLQIVQEISGNIGGGPVNIKGIPGFVSVSANDSPYKDRADYVCDGVNDADIIKQAILDAESKGKPLLMLPGEYDLGYRDISVNVKRLQIIGTGAKFKRGFLQINDYWSGSSEEIEVRDVDGDINVFNVKSAKFDGVGSGYISNAVNVTAKDIKGSGYFGAVNSYNIQILGGMVNNDWNLVWNKNLIISGVSISYWYGLSPEGDNVIISNVFCDMGYIYTGYCDNIKVLNCIHRNMRNEMFHIEAGIGLISGNTIEDNTEKHRQMVTLRARYQIVARENLWKYNVIGDGGNVIQCERDGSETARIYITDSVFELGGRSYTTLVSEWLMGGWNTAIPAGQQFTLNWDDVYYVVAGEQYLLRNSDWSYSGGVLTILVDIPPFDGDLMAYGIKSGVSGTPDYVFYVRNGVELHLRNNTYIGNYGALYYTEPGGSVIIE
jgi:hypothetical protein